MNFNFDLKSAFKKFTNWLNAEENHQPHDRMRLNCVTMESKPMSPMRFLKTLTPNTFSLKKSGIFVVALLSFVMVSGQATQPPACTSPTYTTAGTDINVFPSECNNELATISSLIDSNAEEAAVFFFNLKNGSATEEQFPSIVFNNGNTNVDWSLLIAEAELISEENESITTTSITATNITFSGIGTGVDEFGELDNNSEAPDGREYALYIYFNTSTNLSDIDGENLVFELDNTSFPGSSGFSGTGGNGDFASSGASNNEVTVVATEYQFVQQPTNTQSSTTMAPAVTIAATDENGNYDIDHSGSDAAEVTASAGTMTGDPIGAWSWTNGLATVPAIQFSVGATGITLSTQNGDLSPGGNATSNTFDIDDTAPDLTSVALNTPASSPTNADALIWTFTFTEELSNLDGLDFNITGSTATVTNITDQTGGVYDVTISGGDLAGLDGTVSIDVTVSDITDLAGNALTSGTPTGTNNNSYVVDNTLDLTSVSLNTPASSPTNADALTWTFTFTDVVTNLDGLDFNITGSTATVTNITDQTGGVYDVTISGGDLAGLDGTVSIDVTVSDIVDDAGNALSSGTPTGTNNNSYVVDNTLDLTSVALNTPASSPTNADALIWTFTFTDEVTNLDGTDFNITGSTATVTNITDQTGGVYDVTISGGDLAGLDGTISIDVTVSDIVDDAGNALSSGTPTGANNNSYVVDNTAPTITDLNLYDTDFDGFIDRIDVVFDDNVDTDDSNNPTIGDFGILRLPDNTQVTGGTFSDPAGSSNIVQITNITDQVIANTDVGTASISNMIAGAWVDDAGNSILATGADGETVNDNAAPAVINVTFYDDTPAAGDGLIDRLVLTWSEVTLAVDATLDSEFDGFVTLPDGTTATIGVITGDGTTSFDVSVSGQALPATSARDIYTAGEPITLDIGGLTTEFTDGVNTTSNPDDNESFTDMADPILIGSTPADDAPSASLGGNLTLAFSEFVILGTGNITIVETGVGNHDQIDVVSEVGQISGVGNDTLSINPGTDYSISTNYHVLVDGTSVDDLNGLSYAGISLATDLNFTTTNADLGPGDLAFTGFDENVSGDALMVVLLRDFDGSGTPITITFIDDEWNGSSFSTSEGYLSWVIDGFIPAGTEILFTEVDNSSAGVASPAAAVSATQSFTRTGSFNLNNADESVWAVVGSRASPEAFLTFIVTTDDSNDVNSTSGTGLDADGTLNTADDFFVMSQTDDVDYMQYSTAGADRSGEMSFDDYWTKLRNESTNWTVSGGGNIGTTLNNFTIDNFQPLVASIEYNTPAGTPTNADALIWDVTFSDLIDGGAAGTAVVNVNAADFAVSGGTTATVTNVSGSNLAYQVTVSGGDLATFNGTVTLGFSGGQDISDAAGNVLDVGGSTPSPNENFYTIDNTPPTFGANSISNSTIQGFDINTQLNELGDVYWVVVSDGATAPSVAQVIAGQDNTGSAALDAGTINIDVAFITRTGTASGLTPSLPYDVYLVGVDQSGNQMAAVILLNAATNAPDATSDISFAGAFGGNVAYENFQANDIVTPFSGSDGHGIGRLRIRDFGSGDNSPTILENLSLELTGHANLRRIALFVRDSDTEVGEIAVSGSTANFTGLNYVVADGTSVDLDVFVTYQANVTDNDIVNFTVNDDANTSTAAVGSSSFTTPITASLSNTNDVTIVVTATTYSFAPQQPSDVTVGIVMSPAVQVEAVDALGNRDVDYTAFASITSDGTMSPTPVNVSITGGIGTAGNIVHTVDQTGRTLTVGGALTSANSSTFTVRPLDTDSDAQLVTGGETAGIDYAANQQTNLTSATGVSLATIDITDAGTQDQVATILTDLQFSITNDTYLRKLALYDDLNNELAEITVSGATASFTGMSFSVPDGTTETLTLRGSFTTNVVDNTQVAFTLTSATAAATGSSNFTAGTVTGTSSTAGTDNEIVVTATQVYFQSLEPQSFFNEAFTAVIQAVDANFVHDVNSTVTVDVSISSNPAGGTLSGTTSAGLTAGEVTISDLSIDNPDLVTPYILQVIDNPATLGSNTGAIFITTPDTDGQLSAGTGIIEAGIILDATDDADPGIQVYDFRINDSGTADGAPTLVTDIIVQQGGGNSAAIDDWTEVFAGARLTDSNGQTFDATGITATTIEFAGMPTGSGNIGEIPDIGGINIKTYTLSVWTQSAFGGTVAQTFDGKFLEFEVGYADVTTDASGSRLDPGTPTINSGGIDTEVVSDQLSISTFPTDVYLDFNFSIGVEAIDANGNRDLDENSTVTITTIGASPGGVTSTGGTSNRPLSAGIFTWTDLQVSIAGTYQFQIDDTLLPTLTLVQSGTIATSDPDNTSLLDRVAGEQTTQIEYIDFQGTVAGMAASNSVEVLTFQVSDPGGDGIPTIINSIQVDEISGNSAMLRAVGIFDGSTRLGSVAGGATNTIALSPSITVADGATDTYSVRVSFENTVTDNTQFEFNVASVSQPATASSTIQGGNINATSTTNANDNTINVTATTIAVLSIDDPVIVGQNFTATAEARDSNGNLDEDFTNTITASTSVGAGDIDTSGGNDQATTADGTYDFSNSLSIINGGGSHTILFDAGGGVNGTAVTYAIYNTSDIIVDPGFTHPTFINYLQYDEATILNGSGNSLVVAQFLARDGAGTDVDDYSTFVTSIEVDLDADAEDNVTALALFDGSGNQIGTQQTVAGASVTFTIPLPYLEIADASTVTLRLRATFDQAANINDGEQMQFSIGQIDDNDGGATESDIADNNPTGIQTPTAGNVNTIDVIGDRIIYTTNPGSTTYERNTDNINFDIEARDIIGNLDTDETSVLNISGTSALGGAATILNGASVTLAGGTASKTIQIDNEHEDMTLTVSDPGPTGSRTGGTTLSIAGSATLIDIYDTTDPIIVSKTADLEPDDGAVDVTISSINNNGLRMVFSEEVAVNPAGGNIVVEGNTSPITEQFVLDILSDVTIDPDGDNPNEVELSLPSSLTAGVDYYVIIPTNTFRDDPNNNTSINGGGNPNDVNDFAGYLADTDWTWTMENVVAIVNASYSPTTITLEFNIPVQISGTAANVVPYFTLTDQSGTGSAISLAGATLNDASGGDEFLELNVDLSGALGDVEITYSDPSPGVADGISEDGNTTVELADITAGDGPILNLDNTIPTLQSATEISTTDITLTFSEPVQIDTEVASDFVVTDGQGTSFTVTNWNDATLADDELELVVNDFSAAVGDLTITYVRTTGRIQDFGGNGLVNGQNTSIDRDVTVPVYTSATADPGVDPNRITMNFSEIVQTNGINLSDFEVEDGAAQTYEVFVQSASGSTVLLTTADFSDALGDLTVTYTNNSNEIRDYGGNAVVSNSHVIVLDAVSPSMVSASKTSNTTLTVTFDEDVQLINGAGTTTGFTVVDELGNPYAVSGQAIGGNATQVIITTANLSAAVGDLLVSFADPGAGQDQISDFADNIAATVGPLTIDLSFNGSPVLAENALPSTAAPDFEPNDVQGDNLAMFRTRGVANPSGRTPVNILPILNGSTITVYRDASLTQIAHQQIGVSNITGFDITVAQLLNGTTAIDFAGINDNGAYTFYITETAQNGTVSQGPPGTYSVAFLDDIGNSENSTTFNESGGDEVVLTVEHPTGQLIQFSGNALSSLSKNPGATTSVTFLVDAATTGQNQIEISWENSTSLVEATFAPVDLLFTINASVEVFKDANSDRAFGRNETITTLEINNALGTFDVAEVSGQTASDNFYNIEAYYVVNGQPDITIGVPGRANAAGGNIAGTVLTYDGTSSNGGTNHGGAITPGLPSYIDGDQPGTLGEWQFDPSALPTALGGASTKEVDTVRLYTISQNDAASSQGIIFFDEIYVYPDPTVSIENVNSFYCEDETSFLIEARIVTYDGTGGVDSTGVISNGYVLEYYGNDNTYTVLDDTYNFTGGSLSKELDPLDPNQDGDTNEDETGFYRIIYDSEPQTAAGTIGQATFDFEVRAVETAPVVDLTTGLDVTGGFDGSKYVFEFCSGEDVIPNIPINVVATPADPNSALVPNSSFNWYFSNGNLITDETNTLDPLLIFSSNPPSGTVQQDIYVTRIVDGCESDPVSISIRTYAVPQSPAITVSESVANDGNGDGNNETNVTEDGGDYFFEYCSQAGATITYDDLVINSSLEDIPADRPYVENRTYFKIYDDDGVTPLFNLTNTGGPYTIDLATNTDLSISSTASNTADGVILKEFYISKVTADSTLTDPTNGEFVGCESDLTKVTTAIYTYPEIPNDFTGNPRDDGGVINYYMCAGEDFPDIGVNPASTATFGETEFEWFSDAALGNPVNTTNRRGEVVSQSDLEGHLSGTDFDATVPGEYTYWVRFRSNINENSGFAGCESEVQQVNLTVFPQSVVPTVDVTSAELLSTVTDPAQIGNFDVRYNFCVFGGSGLDPTTEFVSSVTFPGTPTSGENEMLWFTANAAGDAIISSNPVATGDDSSSPGQEFVVRASGLQIQNAENQTFNFAVIHRADFFTGYNGFTGCFSDATDTVFVQVVVSTIPETQFTFSGITEGETTTFDFIDGNSVGSNVDVSFEIRDVNNGNALVTSFTDNRDVSASNADFQYTFANSGTYDGILSITSSAGCELSTTRRFEILDKIQVSGSYFQSFDNNDGGWVAEFQSDDGLSGSVDNVARVTSWEYGTPDGDNINTTRSGTGDAWTTTGTPTGSSFPNNYVGGEVSYVYSPAFDISTLTNPAVRFSTYRDLDGTKDGVVLQYSTNDGVSWNTLGDYDITNTGSPSSGQNWYNESAISSSPGDGTINGGTGFNSRRVGWAGQYTAEELSDNELVNGWFESTHELGEIPSGGRDNVRFRFALSASGAIADNKTGDGFGFDDMQIFQLGKNVLIEQFSSTVSSQSIQIGRSVNSLSGNTLMINYFTSLANSGSSKDSLNARNSTGPSARRIKYGIGEVPTSVLDGEVINPNRNNQGEINGPGWDGNDLSIKGLAPAFFTMPLGNGINEFGVRQDASDPGTIAVTAEFVSQVDTIDRDYSFIFAVTEREIIIPNGSSIGGYDGPDTIRNVLRILLPNAAGEPLPAENAGEVESGESFEFSAEWNINNVYDADQLRVIAFIQDNETKTILQAGWVDIQGATESILGIEGVSDFNVYPNPGDKEVTVEFAEIVGVETDWVLYDQTGREVYKGTLKKGTQSMRLETDEIPSGLYFFHLYRGEEQARAKRIIIAH